MAGQQNQMGGTLAVPGFWSDIELNPVRHQTLSKPDICSPLARRLQPHRPLELTSTGHSRKVRNLFSSIETHRQRPLISMIRTFPPAIGEEGYAPHYIRFPLSDLTPFQDYLDFIAANHLPEVGAHWSDEISLTIDL